MFSDDLISSQIKEKRWSKLLQFLSTKNTCNPRLLSQQKNSVESPSPLLLACKYAPPSYVIMALTKMHPESTGEEDGEGMLPLHVACACGAPPKAILTLLLAYQDAAWQKDKNGMLPIHIVCQVYLEKLIQRGVTETQAYEAFIDVLHHLIQVAPSTILEVDEMGRCPIEHTLESDAKIEIVRALQKQSQKVRKLNEVC